MAQHGHGDDAVAFLQPDAAHTDGFASREHAHVSDSKANGLAASRGEQDIIRLRADAHADQPVALFQLHGDLAVRLHVDEVAQFIAADVAARGREHDLAVGPGGFILRQRHDGGDRLAFLQRQQVDQRLAARLRVAERQAIDLRLVDHAAGREEQHRRQGVRNEHLAHEVLVARRHARAAASTAPHADPQQIGRALAADYIVTGSIRRRSAKLRLSAQLIQTDSGNQVWAERFDRGAEDLFAMSDELVRTIVGTLVGRVRQAGSALARRKAPANLAAYDCVLRG